MRPRIVDQNCQPRMGRSLSPGPTDVTPPERFASEHVLTKYVADNFVTGIGTVCTVRPPKGERQISRREPLSPLSSRVAMLFMPTKTRNTTSVMEAGKKYYLSFNFIEF